MTQNEMTQIAEFLGMEVLSPLEEKNVGGAAPIPTREFGIVRGN